MKEASISSSLGLDLQRLLIQRESAREEVRKWDELNKDILVEIFGRVETESLLQNIQFVCKSWYRASFVPKCWETIVFPKLAYSDEFVTSVVDRSQGICTRILLRDYISVQGLVYISEKCPALKALYLSPDNLYDNGALISELICKWKNLEFLNLYGFSHFTKILESVSIHCKNFVGLNCSHSNIWEESAAAIVKFTPNLKYLTMKKSSNFPRECLLMILKGCRELEFLNVSDCIGFDDDDTEILQLASHIKSFNCNGSSLVDPDDYDMSIDHDDLVYGPSSP